MNIPFTLDTSFFSPHAVRDLLHLLEPALVNRDLSGSLDLLGDRNLLPAHGNSDDFILANGASDPKAGAQDPGLSSMPLS